jgi:hypothetical protein
MADIIKTNILLTNFATRYMAQMDVADFIAPPFKVKRSSDKYAEYDKSSQRIYDNKISGREKPKEITQNINESTYSCEEYALGRFVSDRRANNADKPINLKFDAVRHVKEAQMIAREYRVVQIAGNNTIVTQTTAPGDWNTASTGTPIADILTAIKTIWQNGQVRANAITVPFSVAIEMIKTDEYKDYFKYHSAGKTELFDALSGLRNLGLEPMVAGMFGGNTQEGGASDPGSEEMWGESVLVFHRQPTPSLETRTFMYSPFRTKNVVKTIRYEEDGGGGEKINIYEDIDELLVDATAAYLFTNTLA